MIFGDWKFFIAILICFSTDHGTTKETTKNTSALIRSSTENDKNDKISEDINKQDKDEQRLLKSLLRSYNKEVRPVKNVRDPVHISFGLAYAQLIDLDEKKQVLVSNLWLRMKWYNHLLTWNKTEFGGIDTINISPYLLWIPDIVLSDNAQNVLGSGQIDQFKTKVKLESTGLNSWYVPTILRSQCAIDIIFFPFDDQKCNLTFLSWAYNGYQVNITAEKDHADLSAYLESGEFDLVSAKAIRNVKYFSCCSEPYPEVQFIIHLQRKALFYLNNLVIPCYLITALGLLSFVLPPACGERITINMTTFLAMTIFMLTIAERTPSSSNSTPLIGKIIISSMVIITLSLLCTGVQLNIFECTQPIDKLPYSLRVFLMDYLAPLLWITPPRLKNLKTDTEFLQSLHEDACNQEELQNDGAPTRLKRRTASTVNEVAVLPAEVSNGFAILAARAKDQSKYDDILDDWAVLAKVTDRIVIVLFMCVVFSVAFVILVNGPKQPSL